MNNLSLAAQTIKENVSVLDVGHALGLNVDRHGRCSCPFHNGKDRNMKLFPGNRGYNCFVCHASGDVISFVQKYYNVQFPDAVRYLNDTFHLGMDIDSPMSPEAVKQAENARKMRERKREFAEWKKRMQFNLALTADEIVRQLEDERDMKRPKTYGEWDQDFCAAVVALPEARQFYEDMMMECTEVKE